jgi:hypothetical protein
MKQAFCHPCFAQDRVVLTLLRWNALCLQWTCVTGNIGALAVESEQSTQFHTLDSAHYHAHVVFCDKKLTRFHARVSTTERTTSGIQWRRASWDVTFHPLC